jgi:hypothetical protein
VNKDILGIHSGDIPQYRDKRSADFSSKKQLPSKTGGQAIL